MSMSFAWSLNVLQEARSSNAPATIICRTTFRFTFVLFTLSLNKSGGVAGINLPFSDTGENREPATVTISVTEAGTIAWNKDFISLAEFIDRLKTYKIQEPDGRILINGDEGALFNAALYVFDEARKTGFQKVFIETKVRGAAK